MPIFVYKNVRFSVITALGAVIRYFPIVNGVLLPYNDIV